MNTIKKIVLGLLATLLILVLSAGGYVYYKLNSIYVKDESPKTETKSKEETEGTMVEGITNILIVGTDGDRSDKINRSDGMMLLTIDSNTKNLKLTSIARDTLVDIPGYSSEKMTHAYAYEGIDLLKEVFEVNFYLKIDKYVVVNFVSFMEVMDQLGGVEIDIQEKDIQAINQTIDSCYDTYYSNKDNIEKEYISKAGVQRLNGYQALAYSRIRKHDSAYARDGRHREVAESVYREFANSDISQIKVCADILLENTMTNISPVEMLNLGYTVFKINDKDIEQLQFPLEEYRTGRIINSQTGWVIEWNKEQNLKSLHEYIYGNEE